MAYLGNFRDYLPTSPDPDLESWEGSGWIVLHPFEARPEIFWFALARFCKAAIFVLLVVFLILIMKYAHA